MSDLTYRSAGVDLELYEQAMQKLPALMKRTFTPGVMDLPGGFAGLFRLNALRQWQDPVLVSGTDGVGKNQGCHPLWPLQHHRHRSGGHVRQ